MFLIGMASLIINDHMNRTAEMIEENASNSFAEADIKKVLGYIKQTGEKGIKHGDLVKKLWRMSANNPQNAISTLLESEDVSAEQVDRGHALNMKRSVPETLLEKTKFTGRI